MTTMPPISKYPQVTDLIPHRGAMLLIDEILALDESKATAAAVVRDSWPLIKDGLLGPTLLIEAIAQTVAAIYGWRRLQGVNLQRGYLVGVKSVVFYRANIPAGRSLTIHAEPLYEMATYGVFKGTVYCENQRAAEAEIQVLVKEGEEAS